MPTEYILPTYVYSSSKDYSTGVVISARLDDIHLQNEWRQEANEANQRIQQQRQQWFLRGKQAKIFQAGDSILWYPKEAKIRSGKFKLAWRGPYKVQTPLPNNTVLLVDPWFYDPQAAWVNINKLKAYNERPPQQQMTQSPFDPTNPAFNDQIGILWIPLSDETSNPDAGQPVSADSSQTNAASCYVITLACPRNAPPEATLLMPTPSSELAPGHQGTTSVPGRPSAISDTNPHSPRTSLHQTTTCRKLRPRDQHHKPLNHHRVTPIRGRQRTTITNVQPPSLIPEGRQYIKSVRRSIPTGPTLSLSGDPSLQLHTGQA